MFIQKITPAGAVPVYYTFRKLRFTRISARIRSLIVFLTVALPFANGQTNIKDVTFKADSLITAFMHTWNLKGGSVAVTKDGKLIYNQAFGYADLEETTAAKPNNLFRIASVSKPVTSIAIMQLVQEGKLELDEIVFGENGMLRQDYYNDVIGDERIYSITVQNLLEHTAGWDRKLSIDGHPGGDPPFMPFHVAKTEGVPLPVGDSTFIRFLLRKGLNSEPGTVFAYSNVGYLILGKVIEQVSGLSYEQYVTEKILHPLSVYDMKMGSSLHDNRTERESEYFGDRISRSCYGDGQLVPTQYGGFNLEAMNAHGGWVATASDLSRILLAVDGKNTFPELLNEETRQLLFSPGATNRAYGKGWFMNQRNNYWHTGSLDGTTSYIGITAGGYTWVFLFNSRTDNSPEFWKALDRLPWQCIAELPKENTYDLYPPEENVSVITGQQNSNGEWWLEWEEGNGDGRIIVLSEAESCDEFPEDGTDYESGAPLKTPTRRAKVIYNGNGNKTLVKDLDPSRSYYLKGYEYYQNADTGYKAVYKLGNAGMLVLKPSTTSVERKAYP
jgi:CubicO group peptidase (beta-lactamase class C family)